MAVLTIGLGVTGCDSGFGVDLTGLWVANTYQYRSAGGDTVDLIERDGASFNLTVDRFLDGTRRVTALFRDGMGGSDNMSGEVFEDDGTFVFGAVVFDFSKDGNILILRNASDTFDFGGGPESATLTIRLTQL